MSGNRFDFGDDEFHRLMEPERALSAQRGTGVPERPSSTERVELTPEQRDAIHEARRIGESLSRNEDPGPGEKIFGLFDDSGSSAAVQIADVLRMVAVRYPHGGHDAQWARDGIRREADRLFGPDALTAGIEQAGLTRTMSLPPQTF